jgi:hypothetical protein
MENLEEQEIKELQELQEARRNFKNALMKDDVEYIIDHYEDNYNYRDNYENNLINSFKLLQYTIIENLENIFKFYFEKNKPTAKKEINSLINKAILQDNLYFLETILETYEGYNLNIPNLNYNGIIDYYHINTSIYEKKKNHLKCLIKHGARVDNIYLNENESSIHLAIMVKDIEILQILVENEYSCNVINHFNKQLNSPLHLAVLQEDINLVKILVENGADLNIKNKTGFTPLDLLKLNENKIYELSIKLQKSRDIIEYLESKNALTTFFTI